MVSVVSFEFGVWFIFFRLEKKKKKNCSSLTFVFLEYLTSLFFGGQVKCCNRKTCRLTYLIHPHQKKKERKNLDYLNSLSRHFKLTFSKKSQILFQPKLCNSILQESEHLSCQGLFPFDQIKWFFSCLVWFGFESNLIYCSRADV